MLHFMPPMLHRRARRRHCTFATAWVSTMIPAMPQEPRQDPQTVQPTGERVSPLIDGVKIRPAVTQVDERGSLCEIFSPAWGFHDAPLVYLYTFTISVGRVKGWVKHHHQDDRIFVSHGRVKIVLYDDRPQSKTYKLLNVLCFSDHQRVLISYPSHIYHAFQNIGDTEAILINLPTKPYNHASPDKFRLPLLNDTIPYRFDTVSGGG